MEAQNVIQVPDNLWPIADFFMRGLGEEVNLNNPDEMSLLLRGFFFLYITVTALAILAYKFGFAKKLSIGKNIIIYILLIIGTFFLTLIFGLNLPLAECLIIIAFVMGIYRLRLHRERNQRTS
ncbi:hypothetical protein GGQ92_000083 [Gracilibacillus halotolerans]|uniref:YlaH-like protein n=1 Tax=Gracilibacillus halotolerans TaxID=74386 RepID=A0A841RIL0_9BACI|nr:YlaH-like family protein [Gracilibacillus halotolerans]MBB6511316.1 hypothetical protein [Gracilibacillus halotolerans]